jgi:hypothetical protein
VIGNPIRSVSGNPTRSVSGNPPKRWVSGNPKRWVSGNPVSGNPYQVQELTVGLRLSNTGPGFVDLLYSKFGIVGMATATRQGWIGKNHEPEQRSAPALLPHPRD